MIDFSSNRTKKVSIARALGTNTHYWELSTHMKMPLAFKIASRLVPRWNEQGKRPRENTVQYEDVINAFSASNPQNLQVPLMGNNNNNNENNNHGVYKTATGENAVTVLNPRNSKLGLGISSEPNSHHKVHAHPLLESMANKTPDQEQREIVQCIAARVLMMQQPDEDMTSIPSIRLPSGAMEYDRQLAFIGSRVPSISFVKYVERLVHNINRWAHERPGLDSVGIQSGILAIEYLERAKGIRITPKSIHRYFLGAFLAAIKFNFDYYLSGTYWAGVGGVRLEELNFLEIEFCSILGWKLFVSPEVFENQFSKTRLF